MSRTAVMLLGASLALGACSSGPKTADPPNTPAPEPVDPPDDDGGAVAEYGAPAPLPTKEARPPEEVVPPSPDDDGGVEPMYGMPAPNTIPSAATTTPKGPAARAPIAPEQQGHSANSVIEKCVSEA